MTNEQLRVLLDCIAMELDRAIGAARVALAAERPGVPRRYHVTDIWLCLNPRCENPEHWRDGSEPDPVTELGELDALARRLEDRIAMLGGEG